MGNRIAAENVRIKRIYSPPSADDGTRILVDRLWPRGVQKERAAVDQWDKDIAPSSALRNWFGHDPARWRGFYERYADEIQAHPNRVSELRALAKTGRITLLFAAHDQQHNHAIVLRDRLLGRHATGNGSHKRGLML